MSLSRSQIGTPGFWSIGVAGDEPSVYPIRTTSRPRVSQMNGRMVEIVDVIALRKNKLGEPYTREELLNTRFIEDRTSKCVELDGEHADKDIRVLVAEHAASLAAFRATRAAKSAEFDVSALITDLGN